MATFKPLISNQNIKQGPHFASSPETQKVTNFPKRNRITQHNKNLFLPSFSFSLTWLSKPSSLCNKKLWLFFYQIFLLLPSYPKPNPKKSPFLKSLLSLNLFITLFSPSLLLLWIASKLILYRLPKLIHHLQVLKITIRIRKMNSMSILVMLYGHFVRIFLLSSSKISIMKFTGFLLIFTLKTWFGELGSFCFGVFVLVFW